MSWLTLDLVSKIIIPLVTFGLGVAVTLWTKHREAEKADSRIRAAEAVVLLNEWYDQIHELSIQLRYKLKGRAREQAIDSYAGSRHILPKLIRVRETLATAANQPELVAEIDGFLNAVARVDSRVPASYRLLGSYLKNVGHDPYACIPHIVSSGDDILKELDVRVQRASHLAARALA